LSKAESHASRSAEEIDNGKGFRDFAFLDVCHALIEIKVLDCQSRTNLTGKD
jgi:hypothetical protein